MHPFLTQQMAQLHREELQREGASAQAAHLAHLHAQGNARAFWYLIFGLPVPTSAISEARLSQTVAPSRLQDQMRAIVLTIGLGAFGIGSLIGSFLGTRFGLLPATLLGCIICLAISLPMLRRSLNVFREHLHL